MKVFSEKLIDDKVESIEEPNDDIVELIEEPIDSVVESQHSTPVQYACITFAPSFKVAINFYNDFL